MMNPLAQVWSQKYGYRRIFNASYWYFRAMSPLSLLLVLQRFHGVPGPVWSGVASTLVSGWGTTIIPAVDVRIVGAANNAKFQTMMQLVGFVTGSLSSLLYPYILFDAEAVTWVGKMAPFLVAAMLQAAGIPFYIWFNGPLQLAECDKLTAEDAAVQAGEGRETDAKKTE